MIDVVHTTDGRKMRAIIFHRAEGWYPTEYPDDYTDWQAEADRNLGTTKITDVRGTVLWVAPADVGGPAELKADGRSEMWVIRKRGLFYRPAACGYTDNLDDAGKFDEATALKLISPDDGVVMHRLSEFPETRLMKAEAEIGRLTAALGEAEKTRDALTLRYIELGDLLDRASVTSNRVEVERDEARAALVEAESKRKSRWRKAVHEAVPTTEGLKIEIKSGEHGHPYRWDAAAFVGMSAPTTPPDLYWRYANPTDDTELQAPAPDARADWPGWVGPVAKEVMAYLGHASDPSMEPGFDHRRDQVCRIIGAAADRAAKETSHGYVRVNSDRYRELAGAEAKLAAKLDELRRIAGGVR